MPKKCVFDFCGYTEPAHLLVQKWADWDPETNLINFGGEWWDVAPMPHPTGDITEDAVEEWARNHRGAPVG
jgi:hypothetical protein